MVPFKFLSNFLRILEMPLINCEVNLILTWYKECFISLNNLEVQGIRLSITVRKFRFHL